MLGVSQRNDGHVRIGADRLPYTLTVSKEAKIITPFRVVLRFTRNQRITCPETVIPIPDRLQEGIVSVSLTDPDI
jgi:hypothetical protein